jgi:hypothetical protein
MTPVIRQDEAMNESTEPLRNHPEPAEPSQDAGQSEQDPTVGTGEAPVTSPEAPAGKNPKVPPASETWVEGQPTSDADYGSKEP